MKLFPEYLGVEKLLRREARTLTLTREKKAELKARVMNLVEKPVASESFGFEQVVSALRSGAAELSPRLPFVNTLREKIAIVTRLDAKLRGNQRAEKWLHGRSTKKVPLRQVLLQLFAGSFMRRLTASSVLAVFAFLMVGNVLFHPQITYAKYETTIDDATGEVVVERDGFAINAYKGFVLQENDIVKTRDNGRASVRFLDQSMGRLAENSALKIASQKVSAFNKAETVVDVVLEYGHLWTRVVNLIDDDSHFEVKASTFTAVAKRRAAFDVMISPEGDARVTAVQNHIDIRVASPAKVTETTLSKGFSAEVKARNPSNPIVLQAPKAHLEERDTSWVTENLTKDDAYIAQVKEDSKQMIREQAGVVPGSPLYALEQLTDSTSVALTLNPVDKYKKILGIAESKLAEAVVLSDAGDVDGSNKAIQEFLAHVEMVSVWVRDEEAVHPEAVLDLKASLQTLLSQSHKHFSLVLPTDNLYAAKQAVTQAEVLTAPDPVAKAEQKLNSASEKLVDAHDLAELGNVNAAAEQITEYQKTINEVTGDLNQLDQNKKEKGVEALLDSKKEDIKALEAISTAPAAVILTVPQSVDDQNPPVVSISSGEVKTVSEVKKEALIQIGQSVIDAHTAVPTPEVLQKIELLKQVDINGQIVNLPVEVNAANALTTTTTSTTADTTTRPAATTNTDAITAAKEVTMPGSTNTLTGTKPVSPTRLKSDPEMPATDRSWLKIPQ